MISYRKLAMRVLGHSPVSAPKTARRRSTAKRAAALALTAALVVGMTLPAFADTWFIEDGNISISAGESGNHVEQGDKKQDETTETIITNRESTASSNSVTIEAGAGKTVNVTLNNVNIDTSETWKAAVSVIGKGNTNIELNGNNTLTSGDGYAGLEHNKKTDSEGKETSGTLTITDDKGDAGKLTATGGNQSADIGGGSGNDGQVTITGGEITANGGKYGAGIGGGDVGNGTVTITGGSITATGGRLAAGIGGGAGKYQAVGGNGDVKISGGTIIATGGYEGAGIGGGYSGNGTVTISGGTVTEASGGGEGAGIGGGDSGNGTVNISGGTITKASGGYYGAGIGGGASGNGTVTITGGDITANGGDRSAGIGGGKGYHGQVTITGGEITANGGDHGAGIGGGDCGNGTVTISGGTITEASGGNLAAGIGGGAYSNGTVTISGGTITKASGGDEGAGIGGGSSGNGTVTITDGDITATGGLWGAGIGGGVRRLGNVSIEGNVTIKNAQGGAGAAGIGGGARAEPDTEDTRNKISIKSTEAGSPTITATGGGAYKDDYVSLPVGAAAIGSGSVYETIGEVNAKSDIIIEGKVTINATGGGNVAIGDNDGEKVFNGLAGGTNIKRTDSNGKDVTQDGDVVAEPEPEPKPEPEEPEKPAQPTVTPTGAETAEAPSTGSVEVEHPVTVEGLYVTNVLGKQITHTCTQNGTTLTIRANGIVTSAHLTLGMVRTLKAQGVKTLVFTTLLSRSTTVSVDALLAADPDAPDETPVVWTHTGVRTALTIGGADHSALLK